MKVTIRTLQQKTFLIDAEPSETVADLKAKIASTYGHTVDTQKLIYSGKVLSDETTVEKLNLEDKKFIVLMTSKPKATPAASSSSTSAAKAPEPTPAVPVPVPAAVPIPEPTPAVPAATAAPAATPVPVNERVFGDTSSFLSGAELQATINNMVEMGFERALVMRALKASYNNPDRAVEYLMNGIPEHLAAEEAAPPAAQPGAAAQPAAAPAATAPPVPATAAAPQNLFQLAHQQQQNQAPQAVPGMGIPGLGLASGAGAGGDRVAGLREMLATNPAAIQPLIQQLAAANPQVAQQLANNPEALLQILDQIGAAGGFEGEDGEGGVPPGANTIQISPEDRPAIERLVGLGFTPARAAQAYFAFDKNEELAANFLFENPDDDED